MLNRKILGICALSLAVVACSSKSSNKKNPVSLSVMSYNVENFFDAEHAVENGVDKNDYQYLPIDYPGKIEGCIETNSPRYLESCKTTDWSEDKVAFKLERTKKAILASGGRPDILGLSEVENENVVEMIKEALGYTDYVMTKSPDSRGIDVAILYDSEHLFYLNHQEVVMEKPFYTGKGTRNLLKADFLVRGMGPKQVLGVYMNHWPSQGNPDKVREEVAIQVKELVDENYEKHGEDYKVIVMGDFNTVEGDKPFALDVIESDQWKHSLIDVEVQRDKVLGRPKGEPEGSYYFTGNHTWNRLDRIYVSSNLMSGLKSTVELDSFDIVNEDFMIYNLKVEKDGKSYVVKRPNRFNHHKNDYDKMGVSDHFPVVVNVKFFPQ